MESSTVPFLSLPSPPSQERASARRDHFPQARARETTGSLPPPAGREVEGEWQRSRKRPAGGPMTLLPSSRTSLPPGEGRGPGRRAMRLQVGAREEPITAVRVRGAARDGNIGTARE